MLNRVHLNPVFQGSNMPSQAQQMKEISFKLYEMDSVGYVKMKAICPLNDLTLIKVFCYGGFTSDHTHIFVLVCSSTFLQHVVSQDARLFGAEAVQQSSFKARVLAAIWIVILSMWLTRWKALWRIPAGKWDISYLTFIWKGSKRASSLTEPPIVDQLVTGGVNRGREWMCGQEVIACPGHHFSSGVVEGEETILS